MSIVVKCPGCGKSYKVRDELAGKRVKCKCGQGMIVPTPAPEAGESTYDLAPMEAADPLSAPLQGALPPSQGPVLPPPAVPPPTAAAAEPPEKARRKAVKKAGQESSGTNLTTVATMFGLMAVPVVVILIVLWLVFRPGFGSPEEAYAAHQEALLRKRWKPLIRAYSPESRETILIDAVEILALPRDEASPEVVAVFKKYGVQKAMESDSPEDASAETAADSSANATADPSAEATADASAESAEDFTFPDYAELARKRRERLKGLVAGVEDKIAFYVDLMTAVEAIKQKSLPENPVLAIMMKKPEGETRRIVAKAELSDVNVEGETASAEITFRLPGDDEDTVAPIAFKKVGGRWYLHLSGPEDYDSSPFRSLMGGAGIFWLM